MIIYACQIEAERGNNISSNFPLDRGIDCLGSVITLYPTFCIYTSYTHNLALFRIWNNIDEKLTGLNRSFLPNSPKARKECAHSHLLTCSTGKLKNASCVSILTSLDSSRKCTPDHTCLLVMVILFILKCLIFSFSNLQNE